MKAKLAEEISSRSQLEDQFSAQAMQQVNILYSIWFFSKKIEEIWFFQKTKFSHLNAAMKRASSAEAETRRRLWQLRFIFLFFIF